MSFQLRVSEAAQKDLERLFEFLQRMIIRQQFGPGLAIEKAYDFAETMPFACRKADPANPFLRELVIPFGAAGYVALFEVENNEQVTILAIRHQREEDLH